MCDLFTFPMLNVLLPKTFIMLLAKIGKQLFKQFKDCFQINTKMLLGDTNVDLQSTLNFEYTQPNTVLLKEPGLYGFLLRCKVPKAEPFLKCAVETVLPREIEKTSFGHWKKKDAAKALLTDYRQERDNQIKAIKYENVALQTQRDVYQTHVYLKAHYVNHARYPAKNNIILIVRKHTTSANDKYHDLPYYASRTQRRKRYVKLRWLNWHFPDMMSLRR